MKRSEMINIIKKNLLATMSSEQQKRQARNILNSIENAGMLPPYVDGKYNAYNIMMGTSPLSFCKWEPEDEQK